MNFVLVALILNIQTGEVEALDRGHSYAEPEQCIAAMNEGKIEHATDGKVRSYLCVREDQLGERTT